MRRFVGSMVVGLVVCAIACCMVPAIAVADSYQFAGQWGTKGTGNGQFDGLGGIAVDGSGNVYVSDKVNTRIEKFNANGTFLAQWGTLDSTMAGLAVDRSGNVYAADYAGHRILKFDPSGTLLLQFDTKLDSDVLSGPENVAVDSTGIIWVSDLGIVKKFSASGSYLGNLAPTGYESGQIYDAAGVAVDSSDNVYVADRRMYRIEKFTASGTYLAEQKTLLPTDANLLEPDRVAVDGAGNVYVTDYLHQTLVDDASVKKFDSSLVFQTKIGAYSKSPALDGTYGSILNGIAVGASGQVYLADSWNDRVEEFKVAGTPRPTPTPTVNPAVSLKASPKSLKVGHSATISGLVKNFVSGDKTVTIYRKIGGKLTKLKSLTIAGSGAFQWTKKMTKPGKWVLVATYKVGAAKYTSKAVTLTVRK